MIMETQVCSKCGEEKELSEFYKSKDGKTGIVRLYRQCKKCHNDIISDRRVKNYRRTDDFSYLSARMMISAKGRAKLKGLDFDLTADWIEERIAAGSCEVTGIKFDVSQDTRRNKSRNPWMPSLDRIDNTKGYTKDNVQVVVWLYNAAKGEFSREEFMTLVAALAKPLFKKAIEQGKIRIV